MVEKKDGDKRTEMKEKKTTGQMKSIDGMKQIWEFLLWPLQLITLCALFKGMLQDLFYKIDENKKRSYVMYR